MLLPLNVPPEKVKLPLILYTLFATPVAFCKSKVPAAKVKLPKTFIVTLVTVDADPERCADNVLAVLELIFKLPLIVITFAPVPAPANVKPTVLTPPDKKLTSPLIVLLNQAQFKPEPVSAVQL